MEMTTDSSNFTTVETATLYHNVATDELSQMMMFFAIAIVAGGFSWLVSKCVTVLHKRHLRKLEEEQEASMKYKNQETFVIGNNEAAVFVNGTEVKEEEKSEASLYTRGFGITSMGMFDVAVDAIVRAGERRKSKETDTTSRNGDIFQTPVELLSPNDTPTEDPTETTPVINPLDNANINKSNTVT
ncbi:uncharacterized protein LOC120348471 [Styela clava]|uniref:uncharacterized protein LOC120348471 n=1 Tax=Styela clava TaxID=7725 RepID=UPI001939D7FC|nr:uncharacterized protein LOC120348471 [Styela clava]